jgi:hypothetical protein
MINEEFGYKYYLVETHISKKELEMFWMNEGCLPINWEKDPIHLETSKMSQAEFEDLCCQCYHYSTEHSGLIRPDGVGVGDYPKWISKETAFVIDAGKNFWNWEDKKVPAEFWEDANSAEAHKCAKASCEWIKIHFMEKIKFDEIETLCSIGFFCIGWYRITGEYPQNIPELDISDIMLSLIYHNRKREKFKNSVEEEHQHLFPMLTLENHWEPEIINNISANWSVEISRKLASSEFTDGADDYEGYAGDILMYPEIADEIRKASDTNFPKELRRYITPYFNALLDQDLRCCNRILRECDKNPALRMWELATSHYGPGVGPDYPFVTSQMLFSSLVKDELKASKVHKLCTAMFGAWYKETPISRKRYDIIYDLFREPIRIVSEIRDGEIDDEEAFYRLWCEWCEFLDVKKKDFFPS